jgi:hypothetical protein
VRRASGWAIGNCARFAALWLATATIVALVLPGKARFPWPTSTHAVLTLPIGVLLALFASAFVAVVAFAFFSPVIALWLAVYLLVLVALARLRSPRLRRVAAIVCASLLWATFIQSGDRFVDGISVAVALAYGFVVRPWPRDDGLPDSPRPVSANPVR